MTITVNTVAEARGRIAYAVEIITCDADSTQRIIHHLTPEKAMLHATTIMHAATRAIAREEAERASDRE